MGLSVCHCCSIRRHGTPVPHPREPIIMSPTFGYRFSDVSEIKRDKGKTIF